MTETLTAETAGQEPGADGFSRSELLRELLIGVIERYDPEVAAALRHGGEPADPGSATMTPRLLARTIQAEALWFQLLAIAEQNRDMRRRRAIERERGHEQLMGTFAQVFCSAAAAGKIGRAHV